MSVITALHGALKTVTLFVLLSLGIPSGMDGAAEASSRYELSSSSSSSSPSASSSETGYTVFVNTFHSKKFVYVLSILCNLIIK